MLEETRGEAVLLQDADTVRGKETSTRPTFDAFAALVFQDQAIDPFGPQQVAEDQASGPGSDDEYRRTICR